MVRTDVASAEMVKLASNAFLATKISFINEIANVSEELGADVNWRSPRAWASTTGSARSSCSPASATAARAFPKDVQALKQLAGNTGYHFQLLTAVIEVNELQKRRTIGKLQKHLGSLVGKEIALLGVAFKPNTDDIREATSLVLAGRLQGEGANVRVYDPVATDRAHEQLGGRHRRGERARGPGRRRRGGARDRVARVPRARLGGRGQAAAELAGRRGRTQLPRPRGARGGRLHLRGRRSIDVQALVLSGGEGTRLRPLTYTTPKAVMPLAGRPFLTFMLDWLHGHGVDDVVLSCGFLSAGVRRVLGDIYQGMRLRYVVEEEPLGTAGPVRLALDEGILEDRLIVANGDVLTDIDLTAQIAWHEERGARADPRARGGGRHEQLRRGAHGRRRPRGGLPREERRRGAHEPDQRRRVRARARRDRGDPLGPAGVLRARDLPVAGRRVALRLPGRTSPTGSTSGRPSATSRPPGTCSRGAWRRPCRRATRPARWCSTARSWRARTWARRACSAAAARWAPTPGWSARCCTTA